jgi:hypothetical protein
MNFSNRGHASATSSISSRPSLGACFVPLGIAMDEFYTLQDFSHDPKLAAALGNMVVAWAYAEHILLSALSRITGIGRNMSLDGYYRIPTFEARVKFILALIPEWKTGKFDKDAITEAIEKLNKLSPHATSGFTAIGAPIKLRRSPLFSIIVPQQIL